MVAAMLFVVLSTSCYEVVQNWSLLLRPDGLLSIN